MRHIITAVFKRAALMLLTVVSLSSCIYDKYNTVQFNIYADAIGTDGKVLPDYLIENKHIYFFVNERYFDRLVPDADGGYNVSFPEGSVYTFVAAASEDSTAFRFNTPIDGDHIHTWYCEVLDYSNIPPIYWGTVSTDNSNDAVRIQMRDIRCRSHVLIQNMRNRYGDSNYSVVIGGLRRSLTFDGEACGDIVEVFRNGAFQGEADKWLSEELISLPTAPNEGINIRIQRGDGELIAYADVDDDGNKMSLNPGDDVVFIITLHDRLGVSVTVAPWSDVYSDFNI